MEDLLFQKNGSTKTSRVKIGLEYSKYFYKLIKLRAYGGGGGGNVYTYFLI